MPRREDERFRNLSGTHPAACTCVDCVNKFLSRMDSQDRGPLAKLGFLRRLFRRR
ncbi:MAG: hypothetical protein IIC99_02015 [Chloroflexi bacterium]|nr:hypothetical protein [Chloroflexota bacterium]